MLKLAIDWLTQLRRRGIQISIDDFGTGYSSLSYLYRLPLDKLKIDQSFISRMAFGGRDYKIAQAMVTLSQQLGLTTIAEGIETESPLQWLRLLQCELSQGYLFARPLPPEQAFAYLNHPWPHQ